LPPSSKIHSGLYTYPIVLRLDKQSHDSVEKKFAEELLLFKNGNAMDFYRGGILKNVRVHLELLASLQDQPERRKANYIMLFCNESLYYYLTNGAPLPTL
jgi:hypothetical protein